MRISKEVNVEFTIKQLEKKSEIGTVGNAGDRCEIEKYLLSDAVGIIKHLQEELNESRQQTKGWKPQTGDKTYDIPMNKAIAALTPKPEVEEDPVEYIETSSRSGKTLKATKIFLEDKTDEELEEMLVERKLQKPKKVKIGYDTYFRDEAIKRLLEYEASRKMATGEIWEDDER